MRCVFGMNTPQNDALKKSGGCAGRLTTALTPRNYCMSKASMQIWVYTPKACSITIRIT